MICLTKPLGKRKILPIDSIEKGEQMNKYDSDGAFTHAEWSAPGITWTDAAGNKHRALLRKCGHCGASIEHQLRGYDPKLCGAETCEKAYEEDSYQQYLKESKEYSRRKQRYGW
jgi:hypothetical protein